MMTIYKWDNGGLKETSEFSPSCWINLSEPTTAELLGKARDQLVVVAARHLEGDEIAALVFDAVDAEFVGMTRQKASDSAKGARAEPWEQAPRIATEMHQ